MVAKVIVWDETRELALSRARRALSELEVEGVATTRDLALEILASDELRSGDYSTSTLAELEGRLPSLSPA
jgi:acetyl-CoA carboxylase biotin carboxylase subunit